MMVPKPIHKSSNSLRESIIKPLTEREHHHYAQQPVVYISEEIFRWISEKNEEKDYTIVHIDNTYGRIFRQYDGLLDIIPTKDANDILDSKITINFKVPICQLLVFSPCGRYLLFITQKQELEDSGVKNPQTIGIIDTITNDDLITNIPVNENQSILHAFWSQCANNDDTYLVIVISGKYIEIFKFSQSQRTIRGSKRITQPAIWAWSYCKGIHSNTYKIESNKITKKAAPLDSIYFVTAVSKQTMQPYILDPNTMGVMRLAPIGVNLPSWQPFHKEDVHIECVYDTKYCIHIDRLAARISMRALAEPVQADIVLDALSPGDLKLIVLDNLLVVYHTILDSTLIYDIHKNIDMHLATNTEDSSQLVVRTFAPLIQGGTLGLHSPIHFDYSNNPKARNISANDSTNEVYLDVELRAINLESSRFISPGYVIDDQLGSIQKLSLNGEALIHHLLKEKQSLCAAIQVLLNRTGRRKEVLRLIMHALRLDTPLKDMQYLLLIIVTKFRQYIQMFLDQQTNTHEPKGKSKSKDIEYINKLIDIDALFNREVRETVVTEREMIDHVFYPYLYQICPSLDIQKKPSMEVKILNNIIIEIDDSKDSIKEKVRASSDEISNVCKDEENKSINDIPATINSQSTFETEKREDMKFNEEYIPSDANISVIDKSTENIAFESFKSCNCTCHEKHDTIMCCISYHPTSPYDNHISYILCVISEYMRTLLSMFIIPHKCLQLFLFDICVYFQRGQLLRQYLQYHILVDSPELLIRLFHVWNRLYTTLNHADTLCPSCKDLVSKDEKWIRQVTLDMSLRLRKWDYIVHIMSFTNQYLDIIPLLRRYGVYDFPIKIFLQHVAADIIAQQMQPGLLKQILNHLRMWQSAALGKSGLDPHLIPPCPNIIDCGAWLPGLEGTEPVKVDPIHHIQEWQSSTPIHHIEPAPICLGEVSVESTENAREWDAHMDEYQMPR